MVIDKENRDWQYDIHTYERCKRILDLSKKVGSETLVCYAKNQIADIEQKYPNVRFN